MTPTSTAAARVSGTIKALYERACEVVHHDHDCPAIGGNGDADCKCDAVPFLNDFEALAAIQPDPEPKPVATTSVSYKLQWLAGARPPAHPDPMKGSAAFDTSEAAMAFFSRLADDAKLISLTRTETITTNTDALNIGNSDCHSPSSAGTVSVEAAAKVLMAAQEAYFDGEGGSDALGSLDTEALRALAGDKS